MARSSPEQASQDILPFESAFRLGARQCRRAAWAGLVGTLLVHAFGAFFGARFAHAVVDQNTATASLTIDVDLQGPEPEPVPPPPEPEPAAPNMPSPPAANNEPSPPPPAAQAGQVLAAEPDPNEPLDLTGNTFVVGSADTYAGGVSASSGSSKRAVYERTAQPNGVVGGKRKAPAENSGPDLSRRASPASTDWSCSFPPESDVEQINYMRVPVVVHVTAEGRAKAVDVLNDPGHGFGRAARQCALRQPFQSALDRAGRPVAQSLATVVRFQR